MSKMEWRNLEPRQQHNRRLVVRPRRNVQRGRIPDHAAYGKVGGQRRTRFAATTR